MAGGTRSLSSSKSDEDAMEKLINKVCSNFVKQLEDKIDSKLSRFDAKMSQLCDNIKTLNTAVSASTGQIKILQGRFDNLEQHQKRNSVRLCGLEEEENEVLSNIISEFFSAKLNITCMQNEIDSVFRINSQQVKDPQLPRSVLINFVTNIKKSEIMSCKKTLKGSGYSLYEDLTQSRYELLLAAKKKYGKDKAWSSGGRIFFFNQKTNKKVKVSSLSDI